MNIDRRLIGAIVSLFWLAVVGISPALAQTDPPNVISPLRVEPDRNGVNIADGRTTVSGPTLSVPAAPRLVFDKVQNAAPYILGKVQPSDGSTLRTQSESLHLGEAASESFQCQDYVCDSVTASGSQLTVGPNGNATFTQAGTGTRYAFTLKHVNAGSPIITQQYYASSITYADGEVLTFSYDTATLAGDTLGRKFYRPNKISSNTGYYITITYQGSNFNADPSAWSTTAQATLYNASAPSTPLGQLTYSGNSITDIGGRVYQCTGCANQLGINTEATQGSVQLPTETGSAKVIAQTGTTQLVTSVTNDGVAWNYAYTAPVFDATINGYHYSAVNVTGPDGYAQTYNLSVYNKQNIITSAVDALGRTTSFVYDGPRVVEVSAPEGNKVQVAYDDYGNIVQKITVAKPGAGLANLVESVQPILIGSNCVKVLCYRPAWYRDAKGNQTDFLYNTSGQITERTDPADSAGVRRKTYTTYTLSASGISRPTVQRICGQGTTCGTSSEYRTETDYWNDTLLPSVVRKIDAVQGITLQTTFSYDAAGRLLSADGPLAGTDDAVYNRYDVYGRKTWEIGPLGANGTRPAKRITYRDSDDKVTLVEQGWVVNPADTTLNVVTSASISYDTRRNPVREALAAGGTTYQVADKSWNNRGLVLCQTVRMNQAGFGALPSDACTLSAAPATCTDATAILSAPDDRITRNVYDNAGQLTKVQKAYGSCIQEDYSTFTYSNNGKVTSLTDARGFKASMTYDGFDRQTRWNFPSPTSTGVVSATDYEQYGYDANGNRTIYRKRDGSTLTYSYDNLNRVLVKTVPERAGLAPTHTRDVYYSYNLANLQTQARFDSASGEGLTVAYDLFGRITSATQAIDGANRTLASTYDAHGNRTQLTWPDANTVSYQYDAADRPTAILRSGNASIASYSYDSAGRRITFNGGVNTSYGYDPVGRLSSLTNNLPASTYNNQWSFAFNPAGQIASNTRSNDTFAFTALVNVDRGYTSNGLNQYTAAGTAAFCYDANGNLTADGTSVYLYDVENRLVEKRAQGTGNTNCASLSYAGALQAGLRYDPLGRLYEVTGPSGTTRMLYDGDALTAEYDAGGTLLRRYTHGADGASDDPIAWYEGGAYGSANERVMRSDWQGSIVLVADATGNNVLAVNRYDEYGIPQSTNAGRFQYTGQAWIGELGMYYYKARIYSPTLGRFLQTDPIGYKDQVNLYAYVANDPIGRIDMFGLGSGLIDHNQ